MTVVDTFWLYWAVGLAIGLPLLLISLTELHQFLARRDSALATPVNLLRSYLVPLAALLVLLVKIARVPAHFDSVRVLATVFGFVVLLLVLSGLNATVFEGAPEGSWRKRVPTIFRDVTRFLLIAVGLALIFSYVWGVRVGGLFTALGVTSVLIGLMLQNSVGQIVSGLFMLFEQPFRIGDWLDTPSARGRIVEANWRAVHIQTGHGLQITPNSVLAATSFTNLSRPSGAHKLSIATTFSVDDPPDQVRLLLVRVADALPQRKAGVAPTASVAGSGEYEVSIALKSPADDGPAKATFLRWIWYAARREGLHLDGTTDDFSTPARVQMAMRDVVAPALRLSLADQQLLIPHAKLVRYGTDEIVHYAGEVPTAMTFLIKGTVRRTSTNDDGSVTPLSVLEEGSFLGLSALTRQPSLSGAHALEEVTALEIDREYIEDLVLRAPLLLQELGRIIEDRRRESSSIGAVSTRR
ncbi:mechanosensitive ion channel family protein [Candidatus Mycobacterium wuenschmannii]|uniref:Mechanosensitive ion channel family protein n=1 Tax=Candidatus Mycobacterium wuenschmannii TaxID=3027808 RepID=A0ABY8W302_9MYCO|nr:mechanosensitive ion channel family protein [Candidatus Mycobacterium wuenschmannii]WIM89466.1 mechanosensitive ion channel family protein [Candidatus Mycobacterium wuenschmannii]